ncbi:rhamnogalacturonan lyase family protein [Hallerella porci]|uniref:Rhamnogalacturonan endolyase n=1 Tax=Hallerella porci TaxID=1945871 RepID=A0ABX5LQ06_9BACT|nr:T9SS type A sorting domain-containing protein [Hallerella porci]PWL04231.1 rhamnogalacturonan endolyase [Hallerella porci]
MRIGFGKKAAFGVCSAVLCFGLSTPTFAAPLMENLNRGLVSANVGNGMLVSFRLLGTDAPTASFALYRDGIKIATIEKNAPTSYLDKDGKAESVYEIAPIIDGLEGKKEKQTLVFDEGYYDKGSKVTFPYKTLKVDVPKDLTMPDGTTCTYTANDMSTGDLDGDGELELILKWDPSNSHDNSQTGYTGNVYLDAYKLSGKKLWRIDLGVNIRAGAHYTQFQVYDYDGDGKAEVLVKTADGTIDGTGKVIGDKSKDYRSSGGTILEGHEYLTAFRGSDGAAISTVDYQPPRSIQKQSKGGAGNWGDNYGNRSERYIAATAYLDGVYPSAIFVRGYYTASYVVAYDFDGKDLKLRWLHKSDTPEQGAYGEGNHNITVGDINNDGYDEIVFGSSAIDHEGKLLYRTGFGHGDAAHLGDLDPDKPGLEFWDVHEEKNSKYADELRGPDGNVIWGTLQSGDGVDNGRGLAADIDSTRGYEMWSAAGAGIYNVSGKLISSTKPSINFRIYFDGDVYDELLDATGSGGSGGKIDKWNIQAQRIDRLFSFYNVNGSTLNNSTKANPCLVADILGDWREELIVRSSSDPSTITIFETPYTTEHRVYTLMHDHVYRLSIAWQNTAYNQPPHLGYYLPDRVKNLTQPEISVVGFVEEKPENPIQPFELKNVFDATSPDTASVGFIEKDHAGFIGENGYWNFANELGSFATYKLKSEKDTLVTLAVVYANGGTANRDMTVKANDKNYTIAFPPTGWDTWDTAYVEFEIAKGELDLTFESLTKDGGPNICGFAFNVEGISKAKKSTTAIHSSIAKISSFNPNLGLLTTSEAGFAKISIYDMRGNLVQRISTSVSIGENVLNLNQETLPSGIYMVNVSLNSKRIANSKMIVK